MARAYDRMARRYEVSWLVDGPGGGRLGFWCDPESPSVLEVVLQAQKGSTAVLHVDDLPVISNSRVEIRDPGVWFELIELEPHRQLQLGLEAHGVMVDRLPTDLVNLRGIPAALGLDLEIYKTDGLTVAVGEVLIDDERFKIDGHAIWG
jgi:hypothetical protein